MKYELVIFDLDGTLLDTTEGIIEAVRYTIEKHNMKELEYCELLKFIGPPIQESFKRFYGVSDDKAQLLANDFREYYKDKTLLLAKPYEGLYETLDELKARNIKIAVATYKREDYAIKLLLHNGFGNYSDLLFGADNYNKLKKMDIIKKCIDASNVADNTRVLMVGDSDNDEKGAQGVGIDFLGVTYGFGYKSKADVLKSGAIGACDSISELINYV